MSTAGSSAAPFGQQHANHQYAGRALPDRADDLAAEPHRLVHRRERPDRRHVDVPVEHHRA